MKRKITTIGNSRGVPIPADLLERLKLDVGAQVDVKLDESSTRIIIEPLKKKRSPEGIEREFVAQVNDFISKYMPALKELAKK